MLTYLASIGVILILLLGWVLVQRSYKLFAHRHPELGPFRDESKGCGSCAGGCGTGICETHED